MCSRCLDGYYSVGLTCVDCPNYFLVVPLIDVLFAALGCVWVWRRSYRGVSSAATLLMLVVLIGAPASVASVAARPSSLARRHASIFSHFSRLDF